MLCKGLTKKSTMCKNHAGDFTYCRHHRPKEPVAVCSCLEAETCPICFVNIQVPERFMLGCSHVFCRSCILEWLKKKRDCPICRAIPSEREISVTCTAPPDGRVYDAGGLPMDWTEEESLFDLVESLHVPSFGWDEPEDDERAIPLLFTWRFWA